MPQFSQKPLMENIQYEFTTTIKYPLYILMNRILLCNDLKT